jgi:hypothetical protein
VSKENFDDDSRWLKRTNPHEKRNASKAERKRDKRAVSDYRNLQDAWEDSDEFEDEDDFGKYVTVDEDADWEEPEW